MGERRRLPSEVWGAAMDTFEGDHQAAGRYSRGKHDEGEAEGRACGTGGVFRSEDNIQPKEEGSGRRTE